MRPIPDDSQVSYYEPRVERIFKRLKAELPANSPRMTYQIWDSSSVPEGKRLFEANLDTNTVYIRVLVLRSFSEDTLAFGIAHEIGHLVEHERRHSQMRLAWIGGSGAIGAAVGYATVWWAGAISGGVALLVIGPPVLLGMLRSGETDIDRFAVQLTKRAGFDATRAVEEWCDLFEALEVSSGQTPVTHPPAQKRCPDLQRALHQP